MNYVYIALYTAFPLCLIVQLYYTVVVHQKLVKFRRNSLTDLSVKPISVIICGRNEEVNLQKNLPFVLQQDYPDFEVIVVNDCSNDDSDLILRELSGKYPQLKTVTITEHERFKTGKKFAVTMGIKAAKNEHLLFTDADCRPSSTNWITMMGQNFNSSTEIVLGYSPYERLKGFVNLLIRFETFFTALNYLSFALAGSAYMGVGRNLAYTKTLFFRGKGFASHMHIPSGDDDLFVNQNATFKNTVIEIDADAQVWSEPKKTFGAYLKQKIRHMGAGRVYKARHKRMLTMQSGSSILFYVFLFALIALKVQWWYILSVYLIRLFVQSIVYFPIFKKLNYEDLKWWLPLFDFIYYFYILALSLLTIFKKKVQWK